MSRTAIMRANEDESDVEPASDEDPGVRPARARRKWKAAPKLVDNGGASPDLVLGQVERSARSRLIVTAGEFEGQLRVGIRQWRVTARSEGEFRPTTKGVSLLPWELDTVIDALTKGRTLINDVRPGALERPVAAEEGGDDGR